MNGNCKFQLRQNTQKMCAFYVESLNDLNIKFAYTVKWSEIGNLFKWILSLLSVLIKSVGLIKRRLECNLSRWKFNHFYNGDASRLKGSFNFRMYQGISAMGFSLYNNRLFTAV